MTQNPYCRQIYRPEFNPQAPHSGRKELIPTSCPRCAYICHGAHLPKSIHIKIKEKRERKKSTVRFSHCPLKVKGQRYRHHLPLSVSDLCLPSLLNNGPFLSACYAERSPLSPSCAQTSWVHRGLGRPQRTNSHKQGQNWGSHMAFPASHWALCSPRAFAHAGCVLPRMFSCDSPAGRPQSRHMTR